MVPDDASESADPEPISPETALGSLDDESFLAFVVALWERRDWTIADAGDTGSWYVDLLATVEWPAEQQTLLRVHLPGSEKPLSGTTVHHFVRTVQQQSVERARIVTADTVAESLKRQAEEFGIEILDRAALVDLVAAADAAAILAEYADHPIATERTVVEQAPKRLVALLDRVDAVDRVDRTLSGILPPNPTTADVASLSFTAFRAALAFATVLFVLVLAAGNTPVVRWLLFAAFLGVTYGLLLPAMATDIYLVRRCDAASWIPTWLVLASFLLVPVMLVAGGVYWVRRRRRTPRGPDGMWDPISALR